jgi:hypothetical protein
MIDPFQPHMFGAGELNLPNLYLPRENCDVMPNSNG